MKAYYILALVNYIIIQAVLYGQPIENPQAKLTIRVYDENTNPVGGAQMRIAFVEKYSRQQSMMSGVTDNNGIFIGEGYSDMKLGADVRKDGYYISGSGINYNDITNGRWLPWNPTIKTILRPVEKPVALYAKKVSADVPVLGQPCGYDLEVGDWVVPYGKGIKRDLIFTIKTKEVKDAGNYDAQGELTFKQLLDGVQETSVPDIGKNSVFRWERQAPENGYKPKYPLYNTWRESLHQKPVRNFKFGDKDWEGYFFRVRTVELDGKIVSAHYGKIRGGIVIEPRETPTCTIIFIYYFNPTPNDRNLEWDTQHNLFSNLSWEESPREP